MSDRAHILQALQEELAMLKDRGGDEEFFSDDFVFNVSLTTDSELDESQKFINNLKPNMIIKYLNTKPQNAVVLHGSKDTTFGHTVFQPKLYVMRGAGGGSNEFYFGSLNSGDPGDAEGGNLTAAEALRDATVEYYGGETVSENKWSARGGRIANLGYNTISPSEYEDLVDEISIRDYTDQDEMISHVESLVRNKESESGEELHALDIIRDDDILTDKFRSLPEAQFESKGQRSRKIANFGSSRGRGVQSRNINKDKEPTTTTTSKNIKLDAKSKTVGGNSGGSTGGGKSHGGGSGMESPHGEGIDVGAMKDCGCWDGTSEHVKDNGDAGTNASKRTKMTQDGSGVQNKNIGKTKTRTSGSVEKMNHVGGKGVVNTIAKPDGMKNGGVAESKIIELPHDTMVEDNGIIKTLPKGTKVVLEMDALDDGVTPDMDDYSIDGVEAIEYDEDEEIIGFDTNTEVSDDIDINDPSSLSNMIMNMADDIKELQAEIFSNVEEEFDDNEEIGDLEVDDNEEIGDLEVDDDEDEEEFDFSEINEKDI